MQDNTLLWVLSILTIYNIIAFIYFTHVALFNKLGLSYLKYAESIIAKNDEPIEHDKIINIIIPIFVDSAKSIVGVLRIVIVTIYVNAIILLISILPDIASTLTWQVLTVTAAFGNAFIMISFNSFKKLKLEIDSTCESYSLLLKSFEYEKEYEDSNDVGTK